MKTKILGTLTITIALLAVVGFSNPAMALTYSFGAIPGDTPLTDDQLKGIVLKVDITGSNTTPPRVYFEFINNSDTILQPSVTITDIYFQDNMSLLSLIGVNISKAGYKFVSDSTPPDKLNFPEGKNIGFTEDSGAVTKGVKYGIAPGESMIIDFAFNAYDMLSQTIYYTVDDLAGAIASYDFRIGMHVQSIGTNGQLSDSFVIMNGPDTNVINIVPEPATMTLLGLGLAGIAFKARRRRA